MPEAARAHHDRRARRDARSSARSSWRCPTTTAAERLAHDLRAYLGPDEVELFPAWETLPFERVSPGVETMGRRLRVMWRLRKPERTPRVVVARCGRSSQRLGPHVEDVEPVVIAAGRAGRSAPSSSRELVARRLPP